MNAMYLYVRPDTYENKGLIAAIQEEFNGGGEPSFEPLPEQDGFLVVKVADRGDLTSEAFVRTPIELADMLTTEHIEFHPRCLSGKPRLKGHRISVGQLIAELLEDSEEKIKDIAENFELELENLKGMYNDVARFYDQYWGRNVKLVDVPPQRDRIVISKFTVENRTFHFASPQEITIWSYLPYQCVAEMRPFDPKMRDTPIKGGGKTEEMALDQLKKEVARMWDRDPIQFHGVSVILD